MTDARTRPERQPTAELILELLQTLETPPRRAPDIVIAALRRESERLALAGNGPGSSQLTERRSTSTHRKESPMTTLDVWTYRAGIVGTDLVGYDVEALDGGIGRVDEASDDVGASYIVVDTGRWIFGRKVMLPASVNDRVDHSAEKVWVSRTKNAIENAPEFDEAQGDDEYRSELGRYYARGAARSHGAR
jgi:hypothetical protein